MHNAIENIIRAQKRLNTSPRSMSERSKLHVPKETISRVLSGKTADPGISTLLDIGETVGLAPYEIFMDEVLAAEFKAFLEIKNKSAESEAERIKLIADNESLKIINLGLSDKISMLEAKLEVYERWMRVLENFNLRRDREGVIPQDIIEAQR